MPNCGMGPRPSPSVPPSTICQTAEQSIISDGNFMLPVPRKIPASEFINHGSTAPPNKTHNRQRDTKKKNEEEDVKENTPGARPPPPRLGSRSGPKISISNMNVR